ncbi:MAG TPA: uracil-DNA glycosylase family protein [Xanthomonadaceae bacterium]|nr:uracil-DNA glycosylase family protein [Xanthomonadaceae bacterium]
MGSPSLNRIHGFPPIENPSARILILGSMPGDASLRANQYYAHPQNLFWRIFGEIVGYPHDARVRASDQGDTSTNPASTGAHNLRDAAYAEKVRVLRAANIALWDVLASCHRKGSLDSGIVHETQQANDFAGFFTSHRQIVRVLFNGATAETCFQRHAARSLDGAAIQCMRLPSTSPANASIPYATKLAAWRGGLDLGLVDLGLADAAPSPFPSQE